MNAHARRLGVELYPTGSMSSYRTYAQQVYLYNEYRAGRGSLAATPGTSNHGWGLAVDVATMEMRSTIDRIGRVYGWSKEWSDAQSEWWHLKWLVGSWRGVDVGQSGRQRKHRRDTGGRRDNSSRKAGTGRSRSSSAELGRGLQRVARQPNTSWWGSEAGKQDARSGRVGTGQVTIVGPVHIAVGLLCAIEIVQGQKTEHLGDGGARARDRRGDLRRARQCCWRTNAGCRDGAVQSSSATRPRQRSAAKCSQVPSEKEGRRRRLVSRGSARAIHRSALSYDTSRHDGQLQQGGERQSRHAQVARSRGKR